VQGRYVDFAQVTADSLDFALEALGIGDDAPRSRLLDLYTRLNPWPDAAETLRRLRAAGFATGILSNGSPDMLAPTVRHAGLADLLDAVLSVDALGIYKPAPAVYQMAVDRFGVPAAAICFVSANGWDAAGAAAFGLRVVWCNRTGQPAERLPGVPNAVIGSLAELPRLLGAAS
jgi:2-haloacid dehalogenase